MPDWRWMPDVLNHVYWERIRAFQLPEDTYSEWVAFAVKQGRFYYEISGGAQGEAGFGEVVFCPPGRQFHRRVIEELSFHFFTFHWRAEGRGFEEPAGRREDMPLYPLGGITVLDHARLSSNYFYMEQLPQASPDRRRALGVHAFRDIWHLVCLERELASASGKDAEVHDPLMRSAAVWIRQHAFGPVVFRDVAARLGFTPVQFTRRFQALMGQSPMDWII
ncbi:helix-turn-helix domain-containing protein [Paenibacillus caseinilyticus]|uniref:AraC family transcriptional regulator n=1 Tax=Paenibacillus caseinilyticus TaxID=3098138 RepID=UPI0022B8E598|nr:AraC family transcriptional regulator [Paenibacillus caseinilyticus]MCZ8523461.1 AraC family transcriptional regulator [Paenibacillus caseinilyticus]